MSEKGACFSLQFCKFFSVLENVLKVSWSSCFVSVTSIRDCTVRRDGNLGIKPCWNDLSVSLHFCIKSAEKTYWLNHHWMPLLAGFSTEGALMLIIMGRQSLPSGQVKRNIVGSPKWWIMSFSSAATKSSLFYHSLLSACSHLVPKWWIVFVRQHQLKHVFFRVEDKCVLFDDDTGPYGALQQTYL